MKRWRGLLALLGISVAGGLGYYARSGDSAGHIGPGRYRDGRGRNGREGAGSGAAPVCVTNWTPRSEALNNGWTEAGATVSANDALCPLAPNSTQTMDLITFGVGNGNGLYRTVGGFNAALPVSHSIYLARKTGGAACTLNLTDSDTAGAGTSAAVPGSGTIRLEDPNFDIGLTTAGVYLNNAHTADCVDVCAWGAQLEQSATVGFYVMTTGSPISPFDSNDAPHTVCR